MLPQETDLTDCGCAAANLGLLAFPGGAVHRVEITAGSDGWICRPHVCDGSLGSARAKLRAGILASAGDGVTADEAASLAAAADAGELEAVVPGEV